MDRFTLDGYRLQLEANFDLAGFLGAAKDQSPVAQHIRVDVELDAPNATREQLDELIKVVESRSPIRDTLMRPIEVTTTLA